MAEVVDLQLNLAFGLSPDSLKATTDDLANSFTTSLSNVLSTVFEPALNKLAVDFGRSITDNLPDVLKTGIVAPPSTTAPTAIPPLNVQQAAAQYAQSFQPSGGAPGQFWRGSSGHPGGGLFGAMTDSRSWIDQQHSQIAEGLASNDPKKVAEAQALQSSMGQRYVSGIINKGAPGLIGKASSILGEGAVQGKIGDIASGIGDKLGISGLLGEGGEAATIGLSAAGAATTAGLSLAAEKGMQFAKGTAGALWASRGTQASGDVGVAMEQSLTKLIPGMSGISDAMGSMEQAGVSAGNLSGSFGTLAKMTLEYGMSAQTAASLMIPMYQEMGYTTSQAGDAMDDIKNRALASGTSVEEFGKLVAQTTQQLGTGYGTTEAASSLSQFAYSQGNPQLAGDIASKLPKTQLGYLASAKLFQVDPKLIEPPELGGPKDYATRYGLEQAQFYLKQGKSPFMAEQMLESSQGYSIKDALGMVGNVQKYGVEGTIKKDTADAAAAKKKKPWWERAIGDVGKDVSWGLGIALAPFTAGASIAGAVGAGHFFGDLATTSKPKQPGTWHINSANQLVQGSGSTQQIAGPNGFTINITTDSGVIANISEGARTQSGVSTGRSQ